MASRHAGWNLLSLGRLFRMTESVKPGWVGLVKPYNLRIILKKQAWPSQINPFTSFSQRTSPVLNRWMCCCAVTCTKAGLEQLGTLVTSNQTDLKWQISYICDWGKKVITISTLLFSMTPPGDLLARDDKTFGPRFLKSGKGQHACIWNEGFKTSLLPLKNNQGKLTRIPFLSCESTT